MREGTLFTEFSPPFLTLNDVIASIPRSTRHSVDPSILERALRLLNLSTLVWAIIRPDDAAAFLSGLGSDEESDDPGSQTSIQKASVRKRNALLFMAWKKFWLIVAPREMLIEESTMELWLEFGTQICLRYQDPTIGPPTPADPSMPEITDSIRLELFSRSALGRYGQWHQNSESDLALKKNLEDGWRKSVRQRETEVRFADLDCCVYELTILHRCVHPPLIPSIHMLYSDTKCWRLYGMTY
jgi:hypothetical protein